MSKLQLVPPRSWTNSQTHWSQVLQSPYYSTLARIHSSLHYAANEFFRRANFLYSPLPITTGCISSPQGMASDSAPVQVTWNGRDVYLADSMQFYLEYAHRISGRSVWYDMLSFRDEPLDSYHLNQFHHIEGEVACNLSDIMEVVERFVRHLARSILENDEEGVLSISGTTEHIKSFLNTAIPSVSMSAAVAQVAGDYPQGLRKHGNDVITLNRDGEAWLVNKLTSGGALWLTHFPRSVVPFYQATALDDLSLSLNADLLLGGHEVVGCGQRHASAGELQESMRFHSVDLLPYDWYVAMKALRPITTSGFGLGIERFLMWLLRIDDIRDLNLIHRDSSHPIRP